MHNRPHGASIDIISVYLIEIIIDYLDIVLCAYWIYCTVLWDCIYSYWASAHDLHSCYRYNSKYILCTWWDVRIVTRLLEGGNGINYRTKLFRISVPNFMIFSSFYKLLFRYEFSISFKIHFLSSKILYYYFWRQFLFSILCLLFCFYIASINSANSPLVLYVL